MAWQMKMVNRRSHIQLAQYRHIDRRIFQTHTHTRTVSIAGWPVKFLQYSARAVVCAVQNDCSVEKSTAVNMNLRF